jgi:hypothetical protein
VIQYVLIEKASPQMYLNLPTLFFYRMRIL